MATHPNVASQGHGCSSWLHLPLTWGSKGWRMRGKL